jgi:putative ABC transport system permease protein
VLIGALSVVNTMTMSTLERVREIGLLRAVGLGRRQVGTILRLESVIITVLGAVAGLIAGCVIGAVAVPSQGGVPVVLPWERLLKAIHTA